MTFKTWGCEIIRFNAKNVAERQATVAF